MPLYDFYCDCGQKVEVFKKLEDYNSPTYCPMCNKEMKQDLSHHNKRDWFRPNEIWDNLDTRPIEITSKKHLREECKKRGLQARALL